MTRRQAPGHYYTVYVVLASAAGAACVWSSRQGRVAEQCPLMSLPVCHRRPRRYAVRVRVCVCVCVCVRRHVLIYTPRACIAELTSFADTHVHIYTHTRAARWRCIEELPRNLSSWLLFIFNDERERMRIRGMYPA
jgi:hypothetical protein